MNETTDNWAEDAAAFLAEFATADDIADECRRRGVKGIANHVFWCPVANLLRDQFPETIGVAGASVYPGRIYNRGAVVVGKYHAVIPKPASAFAVAFDMGKYADLGELRETDHDTKATT